MSAMIKDSEGQDVSEAQAIARYFRRPDESVRVFHEQLKVLTPAAKTELALGAARELGLIVVSDGQPSV